MTTESSTLLSHIAKYNETTREWSPLGGGLNGDPVKLSIDSSAQILRIIGNFTRVFTSASDRSGRAAQGIAVWDLVAERWINKEMIVGSVQLSEAVGGGGDSMGMTVTAGRIERFAAVAGVDAVGLRNNGTLVAYGRNLRGHPDSGGIVDAAAWDEEGKLYIGGSFMSVAGSGPSFLAKLDTEIDEWGLGEFVVDGPGEYNTHIPLTLLYAAMLNVAFRLVSSLLYMEERQELWFAGNFSSASPQPSQVDTTNTVLSGVGVWSFQSKTFLPIPPLGMS